MPNTIDGAATGENTAAAAMYRRHPVKREIARPIGNAIAQPITPSAIPSKTLLRTAIAIRSPLWTNHPQPSRLHPCGIKAGKNHSPLADQVTRSISGPIADIVNAVRPK